MTVEPHLFVILGGTGDLTMRKLLPAVHHLVAADEARVVVLGVATSDITEERYRSNAETALAGAGIAPQEAEAWCRHSLHYEAIVPGAGYQALAKRIAELESHLGLPGNRIFYLALPPPVFPTTISGLGDAGLAAAPGWTRIVIEKPFGRSLDSARDLNRVVHDNFDESQVYRIDHYLGKETVRNLLVFRFTNPIFEASWNRDRIDRIEITVAESLDVGSRGRYYDKAGAIRDMLQSHLTQVLTLVAMESPVSVHADAIREEKVKVLRAVRGIDPGRVVAGQYRGGKVEGRPVPAYRSLPDVAPDSTTPTYAAVRLHIDNWRWQGVPFYLRTGKAMEKRITQVAVTFRRPPVCLFHGVPDECISHGDVLYLTLQPDEGFSLEIEVKEPGSTSRLRTIPLSFSYSQAFGEIPDAYSTLLQDVMEGDQTLFVRSDEVEEAWRLFTPIVDAERDVHEYAAGSWGPTEARSLLGDTVPNWATGP